MDRPHWDRLDDWARAEAGRYLEQGLDPHPTVVFFEGDEATLYVRAGVRYGATGGTGRPSAYGVNELFALGMVIHPEGAAVLMPVRLRSGELPVAEAEGERGILVEWARRRDDAPPDHGCAALVYGLADDGTPVWGHRHDPPDGGPLARHLAATVTGRWPGGDSPGTRLGELAAAELTYGLTRFGYAIGVDPGWRDRYGLDRAIRPADVRPEDRRNATRRWRAERRLVGTRR